MTHCTEYELPDGDLAALFHHASRLMARIAHRYDHGSHAQERVFAVIRENGPLPQRELLERFGVRSASLSEVLAKLERAGRITRTRDENDRRGFIVDAVVSNTASGEDTALRNPHQVLNEKVFAALTDEEREQLGGLLGKVVAALEQEAPAGLCGHGDGRGRHPRGCGRHGDGSGRTGHAGRPGRGSGRSGRE